MSALLTLVLISAIEASSNDCYQSTQQHCQHSPLKDITDYDLKEYKGWRWLSAFEPSGLHWEQFVSVYIKESDEIYRNNHAVYFAEFMDDEVDAQYQEYPLNSTLVKENYAPLNGKPGQLTSITVMIKEALDNPNKLLNWRYQQYSASGQLLIDGTANDPVVNTMCASCHNNVAERDYIFSTQLSTQSEK